ncbi:MAG: glycosyltransferase family 39 protein [Caldilinea sp.]|uniref:ArnT family glycosyltransferase n=1 Tax=Caldilinea sp. TaxID=2293560 RepID=UPI002C0F8404|nr:glycosyltransferase family 39 protein [Anaerolineales bacterium]HQY89967.1 glycosyltransferase family 39 protein [Caldilinea sp.]
MTRKQSEETTAVLPAPHLWLRDQNASLTATLAWLLPLMLIIGLATYMRTVDLNVLGYNSDEAVYAGQGAAIAQVPILTDLFPVFRAHPLLFQFTLAVFYSYDSSDVIGRQASAAIGVATVLLVFLLGNRLYGRRAGLIAALLLAVMPYHVIPTRQVLLDGPMTLYATLTLYLLARFADTERPVWLYAVSIAMGLTFLAKETGILLVGAIYAFLALSPEIRVRIRDAVLSLALMVLTMLPYPLSVSLAGGGSGGKTQQYLVWQLFRRPNHTWDFYLTVAPPAIGIGVIVAAAACLWLLRHRITWREKLLVMWILVPVAFFQLWPTKGFQYLLPIAPPLTLLAARALTYWPQKSLRWRQFRLPQAIPGAVMAAAIAVSLILPTWRQIHPYASDTFLAGSGGVPGGREMGEWIQDNIPKGARFLTIGPSMANIVRYYGHREAFGLSVSPNPLHRNPSYEPISNPDFKIRTAELQYLVWDSFSAGRSTFFSDAIFYYARKYNGRVLHTESVTVTTPDGQQVERPVIIVYEVHPQW